MVESIRPRVNEPPRIKRVVPVMDYAPIDLREQTVEGPREKRTSPWYYVLAGLALAASSLTLSGRCVVDGVYRIYNSVIPSTVVSGR